MVAFPLLFVFLCAAQGYGAKGHNKYHFSLEFFLPVKLEVCLPDLKKKKKSSRLVIFHLGHLMFAFCFLIMSR